MLDGNRIHSVLNLQTYLVVCATQKLRIQLTKDRTKLVSKITEATRQLTYFSS